MPPIPKPFNRETWLKYTGQNVDSDFWRLFSASSAFKALDKAHQNYDANPTNENRVAFRKALNDFLAHKLKDPKDLKAGFHNSVVDAATVKRNQEGFLAAVHYWLEGIDRHATSPDLQHDIAAMRDHVWRQALIQNKIGRVVFSAKKKEAVKKKIKDTKKEIKEERGNLVDEIKGQAAPVLANIRNEIHNFLLTLFPISWINEMSTTNETSDGHAESYQDPYVQTYLSNFVTGDLLAPLGIIEDLVPYWGTIKAGKEAIQASYKVVKTELNRRHLDFSPDLLMPEVEEAMQKTAKRIRDKQMIDAARSGTKFAFDVVGKAVTLGADGEIASTTTALLGALVKLRALKVELSVAAQECAAANAFLIHINTQQLDKMNFLKLVTLCPIVACKIIYLCPSTFLMDDYILGSDFNFRKFVVENALDEVNKLKLIAKAFIEESMLDVDIIWGADPTPILPQMVEVPPIPSDDPPIPSDPEKDVLPDYSGALAILKENMSKVVKEYEASFNQAKGFSFLSPFRSKSDASMNFYNYLKSDDFKRITAIPGVKPEVFEIISKKGVLALPGVPIRSDLFPQGYSLMPLGNPSTMRTILMKYQVN